MNFADRVASQYKKILAATTGAERAFREDAWARYAKLGLPGRNDENWKYTNLNPVNGGDWEISPVVAGAPVRLPKDAAEMMAKWAKEFSLVVTVNGVLRADMSSLDAKHLRPLDFAALKLNFEDGWSGLASALARPGFHLEVASVLGKPILIVHAQTSGATWSPVLNHISLAKGAAADLAEVHLGVGESYLRSEMTSVDLGEDSVFNWVRVQQEEIGAIHFSEVQSHLQARASLNLTQLNGGSRWCRSGLRAEISGERASAHLSGLTFARGRQHIDQRVEARHSKGLTESTQLFKGVLKDSARGVLNGKIYIGRDAQKVSSNQQNHNLLLSKTAEANTKPELEIYADDVKANHGASIGQMDEDKIFYLMSRGVSRTEAQQMLAHAFVGDVLMKIGPKILRHFADSCVQAWLPEFAGEMEHSLSEARA